MPRSPVVLRMDRSPHPAPHPPRATTEGTRPVLALRPSWGWLARASKGAIPEHPSGARLHAQRARALCRHQRAAPSCALALMAAMCGLSGTPTARSPTSASSSQRSSTRWPSTAPRRRSRARGTVARHGCPSQRPQRAWGASPAWHAGVTWKSRWASALRKGRPLPLPPRVCCARTGGGRRCSGACCRGGSGRELPTPPTAMLQQLRPWRRGTPAHCSAR
mmetsp:Transcript_39167/g.124670  ORF Transcript_39167/g.124670 Transcript_39167/m.124670 type:complete len:220 (+) Transcript_39167:1087-1746(+)